MITIERLRPETARLDPEWSMSTVTAILATEGPRERKRRAGGLTARRPRRLAGAVAAATAALIGAITLRPEAAFALDRQADGDVVVTIRSLEDADGLERALADAGVQAEVEYVDVEMRGPAEMKGPDRLVRPGGDVDEAPALTCMTDVDLQVESEEVTFTLAASSVRSDAVLHIATMGSGWSGLAVQWEGGPTEAGECDGSFLTRLADLGSK